MKIYLSDRAIADLKRYHQQANNCLEALRTALAHFNNLQQLHTQNIHEIKRLKCRPSAWRHRHRDFRTVFSASRLENSDFIQVLRIAPRGIVYQGLIYFLEPSDEISHLWQDPQADEDKLIDLAPANIEYQQQSSLRVYQLRGAAGTGKTTVALHITLKAVEQGTAYPILIVPHKSLQKFATEFIEKHSSQKLQICRDLSQAEPSDLAILTKDHLLQQLAGNNQESLSNAGGNLKIRKYLQDNSVNIPRELDRINLYSIYLGSVAGAYNANARDPLLQELNGAIDFVNNEQELIKKALKGRDLLTQAEKAAENQQKFVEIITQLTQLADIDNDHPKLPILIIDEVQDLYWSELKALLSLYTVRFPLLPPYTYTRIYCNELKGELAKTWNLVYNEAGRLIILAGDNNQRVNFSGFSWANFATTFTKAFPHAKPPVPAGGFEQNYRNTKEITRAANYILSAQGTELKAFRINTKDANWIDLPPLPEDCETEGDKPQLVVADENQIKQLISRLKKPPDTEKIGESGSFVLIYNEADSRAKSILNLAEASDNLLTLSVAEAKGQEFESVIILYPFSRCSQQPSVSELFKWYTALTRAKLDLALLLSKEEYTWLKEKVIKPDELREVFDICSIEELYEKLPIFGENIFTEEQERENLFIKVRRTINQWLENPGVKPKYILDESTGANSQFWEFLKLVAERDDQIVEATNINIQDLDLQSFYTTEALLIYRVILRVLLENDNHTNTLDSQLMEKLEVYFTQNPQEYKTALDNVADPISICLVHRAKGYSWEAAKELQTGNLSESILRFLYRQISRDLQRRGLPWEAARLRYKYLEEYPSNSLPYRHLILDNSEGDLGKLLISEITEMSVKFVNKLSSNYD